jgi:hypothetical protein
MIISLRERLGAMIVFHVFAGVWAAKVSSIDLFHNGYTEQRSSALLGWPFFLRQSICYIYTIRRKAHLHFEAFSILASVLSHFSFPPSTTYSHGRFWRERTLAPENLFRAFELHVEYFAHFARVWRRGAERLKEGGFNSDFASLSTRWVDRKLPSSLKASNGDEMRMKEYNNT